MGRVALHHKYKSEDRFPPRIRKVHRSNKRLHVSQTLNKCLGLTNTQKSVNLNTNFGFKVTALSLLNAGIITSKTYTLKCFLKFFNV